jgi:hypothetical protein
MNLGEAVSFERFTLLLRIQMNCITYHNMLQIKVFGDRKNFPFSLLYGAYISGSSYRQIWPQRFKYNINHHNRNFPQQQMLIKAESYREDLSK